MNMLPPAIGLLAHLLKINLHTVELFDSTTWVYEEEFDSDKTKEQNLNSLPFNDSKLKTDIHYGDVVEAFKNKVEEFSPDLIAMSSTENIFLRGIHLLKSITHLNIPVIVGGVFPTFAPQLCLSYKEINMICIGEGEEAIVELCYHMEKGLEYNNVNYLFHKGRGFLIQRDC